MAYPEHRPGLLNTAAMSAATCATAGVAAFNVGGSTLHSALKLPVEDGHSHESATYKYQAPGGEALQDARQAWRDVRYLIIDEISMVSSTMLMYASKRLKEITGKHEGA